MEVKAGYKQTEVGVIPEDWEAVNLSEVVKKFQNGYAFSSIGYAESGMPIVTMAQIGLDGTFQFDEQKVNYWSSIESSTLVDFQIFRGDLIIAMTDVTPEKNLIGRMTIVTEPGPLLLNQRVGLLRLNLEKVVPYFLCAFSNSSIWRSYSRGVASLGVQANIGTKEIRLGKIPLPPTLLEQEAIAEALSDADALIESLEQLISKKRQIKQGTMQELLTGKTRLEGFSGEWLEKQIGDVADLKSGYAFKSETYDELGAYKIITIGNVQAGFMDTTNCSKISKLPNDLQSHHQLVKGDFIISMTGNVGRVCMVNEENCLLNQRVGKLIAIKIFPSFFFCILNQNRFAEAMAICATGGAQGNLSNSDITGFKFSIPPLLEQQAIASVLSDMDAEITQLETKLEKAKSIKQGMMQELLTGRIRLVTT